MPKMFTSALVVHYYFENNADDTAGVNNASTIGSNWQYAEEAVGQVININGGWDWWGDHVALPNDVANCDD